LPREGAVGFEPFRVASVLRRVLDGLRLQRDCIPDGALPQAQRGQVCIRFGISQGKADRRAERVGRVEVLLPKHEEHALIVPQHGVVFLGRGGAANDFLGEVEIALIGGFPGLVGQLARAAAVFLFLLLGVHRSSSMRSTSPERKRRGFACSRPRLVLRYG
jgi:hypothetical protein